MFIPLVTALIPVGTVYIFPILGIAMGTYTHVIPILMSFQMLLDACVTLTVVRDYRRALLKMVFRDAAKRFFGTTRVESMNSTSIRRPENTTQGQSISKF